MFYLAAGDNEETFWINLLVLVILGAGVGIFGLIRKHKARYGSAGALARRILDGFFGHLSKLRRVLLGAIHWTGTKLSSYRLKETAGAVRKRLVLYATRGSSLLTRITSHESQVTASSVPSETKEGVLSATRKGTPKSWEPASTSASRRRDGRRGERDFNSGMELLTRGFLVETVERTGAIEIRDITIRNLCFTELVRRGQLEALSSDTLKAYTLDKEGAFNKSIRFQAMKELAARTARTSQATADEAVANAERDTHG
jgi:hypothetical protein